MLSTLATQESTLSTLGAIPLGIITIFKGGLTFDFTTDSTFDGNH